MVILLILVIYSDILQIGKKNSEEILNILYTFKLIFNIVKNAYHYIVCIDTYILMDHTAIKHHFFFQVSTCVIIICFHLNGPGYKN